MEQELVASAEDEADAGECLHRSLADSDAGRVRLFSEVAAEWRTKYNLPFHLTDEEILRMTYEEDYHGITIVLEEDQTIERHPDGSPDYRLVRLMPTLNNYTDSYIRYKCGAEFPVPLTFDAKETQDKISEVRENVLAKLRGYIDRVRTKSESVPWLESRPLEESTVTNGSE